MRIYSDKLCLSVVDLTQISLATEEDKLYEIDTWASLFKATTWEELKMIAKDNEYLEEAAETAYQLSAEEAIRLQCEAREDFYRQQKYVEHKLAALTKENEEVKEKYAAAEQKLMEIEQENAAARQESFAVKQENTFIRQENFSIKQENEQLRAELERLRERLSP